MIRDGKVPGENIHVLEQSRLGGSLDAAGSAELGYSMRGSRTSWNLRNRDRADLVKLMVQAEDLLQARRIDECFETAFFESNFWLMWSSMFGFETWRARSSL